MEWQRDNGQSVDADAGSETWEGRETENMKARQDTGGGGQNVKRSRHTCTYAPTGPHDVVRMYRLLCPETRHNAPHARVTRLSARRGVVVEIQAARHVVIVETVRGET